MAQETEAEKFWRACTPWFAVFGLCGFLFTSSVWCQVTSVCLILAPAWVFKGSKY